MSINVPEADSLVMEEFTTDKGNKYQVSVSPEEAEKKKEAEEGGAGDPDSKHDFNMEIDWPVTGDVWVSTTSEVAEKAGITRYRLIHLGRTNYRLWFTNTEHYDYQFTNFGGETFSNNTFINRDHFIDLSPDHSPPKFIRVKGD